MHFPFLLHPNIRRVGNNNIIGVWQFIRCQYILFKEKTLTSFFLEFKEDICKASAEISMAETSEFGKFWPMPQRYNQIQCRYPISLIDS